MKKRKTSTEFKSSYCPIYVVCYKNSPINNNQPVWTCRMCLTTLLKETAVGPHIKKCKEKFEKENPKINFDRLYVCNTCKKCFTKKLTLIKHINQHKKKVNRSSRLIISSKRNEIKVKQKIDEKPSDLKICETSILVTNDIFPKIKKCQVEGDEEPTESANNCFAENPSDYSFVTPKLVNGIATEIKMCQVKGDEEATKSANNISY